MTTDGRSWLRVYVIVFTTLLSFACVGWGQELTFSDSADWKPLDPGRAERLRQLATQNGQELVDAASYVHGGAGTVAKARMPRGEVDNYAARNYVAGLVQGATKAGLKLLNQEPVTVGPLPGSVLTFGGSANGRPSSTVMYVVFDEHNTYSFSIYGLAGTTKDSQLVTSYLSRIKFDPSLKPANLRNTAFEMGERVGHWLVVGVVVAGILMLIRTLRMGRNGQPPPLDI